MQLLTLLLASLATCAIARFEPERLSGDELIDYINELETTWEVRNYMWNFN